MGLLHAADAICLQVYCFCWYQGWDYYLVLMLNLSYVLQVSNSQVGKLARLAAGRPVDSDATYSGNGNGTAPVPGPEPSMDDFRNTADVAYAAVDVPDSVIDILTDLRTYLQDKCEPPVYVSDRRFMKSVQLLQVVAFGDGRNAVNEYDCVLLEHVFGNRPDDAHKVCAARASYLVSSWQNLLTPPQSVLEICQSTVDSHMLSPA